MADISSLSNEYEGYFEARGWDKTTSADGMWYYDEVQRKVGLRKADRILEIGFGNAGFLDWCLSRQLVPAGVEIQSAALDKARALGHEVFEGPFSSSTLEPDRFFDVIAAFDVLEHLTISEIRQLLSDTSPHLAAGGRYLFRFPNGASPFVGHIQTGDITHRTLVSPGAIEAIAKPLGLTVECAFNDRMLPPGRVARTRRRLAFALRSAIEFVVCSAYFGHPIPLDPNVFVIVKKAGR